MRQTILEIIAREARLVNLWVLKAGFAFNCFRWGGDVDRTNYTCVISSQRSLLLWYDIIISIIVIIIVISSSPLSLSHCNIIITIMVVTLQSALWSSSSTLSLSHCNHGFDQHEAFGGGTIGKQVCPHSLSSNSNHGDGGNKNVDQYDLVDIGYLKTTEKYQKLHLFRII